MYARTDNIAHKSDEDLKRLKNAGVNDLYIGVECGLNDVLSDLNKGYSADETRAQCLRLNAAGIHHCDLLMLGTAEVYSPNLLGIGHNELIVGKALEDVRENVVIATKLMLHSVGFRKSVYDEAGRCRCDRRSSRSISAVRAYAAQY